MIKIKKIILVIIIFFTYSNKSFTQYIPINEPNDLEGVVTDQEFLSRTIYLLLDCYLENLDQDNVFDLLREINQNFFEITGSTILYYFLKLGSIPCIKLFIFWKLHENLTDIEIQYCENKSLENESFKHIYDLLNKPIVFVREEILGRCFTFILRGGYFNLLKKYSYLLNEEIIDYLLSLKKFDICFLNPEHKKMFKYLRRLKKRFRSNIGCVIF